jgi:homoserine kinase type II
MVAMQNLAAIWGIPKEHIVKPMLHSGYNNTLLRIEIDGRSRFALRIYGNHANPKFIEHELSVLWHLSKCRLPFEIPAPIPTRENKLCAYLDEGGSKKLAILISFIEGKNPLPNNLVHAQAVGEALAVLLDAMAAIQPKSERAPNAYDQLHRVHPLVPDPFLAMDFLGSLAPKETKNRVNAILDSIYDDTKRIYKTLPKQLIHGDVIPGNVLIADDKVSGVLDFENCSLNPRVMDLAGAIDTWLFDALGTDEGWKRFDALCRGYAIVTRLYDEEYRALPTLILLRNANVLMHLVGRFLGGATPFVDVEQWIDSMIRIDDWLKKNREEMVERARAWEKVKR